MPEGQRRRLEDRRNAAYDRVVVVCNTTGHLLALVQVVGKAPPRLLLDHEEMLLQSARSGLMARCRCLAGQHALDVFRFQSEVFKQSSDPQVRRPLRITV
jgi:hypothetical protein